MIDYIFLSFAFGAGFVSFFSPCAIALLPAYIMYFLSKYNNDKDESNFSKLVKGLSFGSSSILGFITIFGVSGLLLVIIGQAIKPFIPRIAIFTGGLLIIIGLILLFKKNLLKLNLPTIRTSSGNEKVEAYLFGVAYAIGALGCTFPIFLAVVLQGFTADNFIIGILPLLTYISGLSVLMLVVTMLVIFSREWISKKIEFVLPYIGRLTGIILIGVGIYMIWYQSILL